jgi:UTP:GlnB (protein PII) uridylyltransferase
VQIDNESYDDVTVITIDSANRPGTLIEVVQCLTELNLSIRRARISSSQSWFVDGQWATSLWLGMKHSHRFSGMDSFQH